MKKEIEVCARCNNQVAVGKCEVCGIDICKIHGTRYKLSFGRRNIGEFIFCVNCFREIEMGNDKEMLSLHRAIIEAITKELAVSRLK